MDLVVFWIAVLREERKGSKIIGRTPICKGGFLFTNPDGTLMPLADAMEKVRALQKLLPPDCSLEFKEERVETTTGTLRFSGKCPTHGARENEFFCGKCGTPTTMKIEP